MKYESDILKRLINTYGVVGNPCYISEIIKEFIVRGKECYPELFTYQSDWLAHIDEFGLNPSYTVSYTGQSIYAPNTLERPVKSAILSGNTLVNLCDKTKSVYSADGNKNLWQNVLFNTNPTQLTVINHTDKVIKFTLHNRTTDNWVSTSRVEANSKSLVNCGTNNYLKDLYGAYSDGWSNAEEDINILKDGVLILEGDHTQEDISYFEGMQSVKMPLLTTSNEDATKTNILSTSEDVVLRGIGDVKDTLDCLTGEVTQRIGEVVLNGSENWQIRNFNSNNTECTVFTINLEDKVSSTRKVISDKFSYISNDVTKAENVEGIYGGGGNISFFINVSNSKATTVEEFKSWLSTNNVTIQYLKTPTIKTVDLTILDQNGQNVKQLMSFNGGTHFITGSLEGTPLPSVSVSVETDLEETIKVCSLEGNTL